MFEGLKSFTTWEHFNVGVFFFFLRKFNVGCHVLTPTTYIWFEITIINKEIDLRLKKE